MAIDMVQYTNRPKERANGRKLTKYNVYNLRGGSECQDEERTEPVPDTN